ncbi:MAG: site-specific integrase [Fimbriimonadaceae bacterium]|nr:site-specific integrase [Alphaproteobacteria bacterium]
MPSGKITKRSVDAFQPGDKDTFLWDDDLPGFGLKVTPSGRKVYLIQYRMGGRKGRTRRFTVGMHGVLTPDRARLEAKKLLGNVAAGRDPADARDKAKATMSVGEVLERFLAEHVDAKLKASTATEYHRTAKLYVRPALRHRLISDVKRSDIARLHHSLKDKPYQANRTVALLSKLFNWAEKHGLRPDGTNPCRHVEKYPEQARERFLSEAELARLGTALREAQTGETESPWVIAAIRLLSLTGARLGEILTLKWEYVDFDRASLRLPDSKTGQKTIYLNAPALEVLAGVPRLEGNAYVICGDKPGAHLVNLQKPWRRIRKTAGLEDVRLHDLRHSFASVAAAGGLSLPIIGALLGHSLPQTTARYAHLSADPLKAASDAIAGRIASAMTGNEKGEVIPFSNKE